MNRVLSRCRVAALGAGLCLTPALHARAVPTPPVPEEHPMAENVYEFTVTDISGAPKRLSDYRGRVLLIVNVASECGFTPQYKGLEALYRTYHARGLDVLGFPSNDFFHQEPGTDAEIKTFCDRNFQVTFDLFSKIHVREEPQAPLYRYLTHDSGFPGAVSWNFNKYLVGRDGKVLGHFGSTVKPDAPELVRAVEAALDAKP